MCRPPVIRNLFPFIFLFLLTPVFSQEKAGNFMMYKAGSGISSGLNYRVCQSSDGFLWIGTGNGLVRFDGKYYQRILAGANSITDNLVNDVAEDASGRLWIGGFTSGVSRYDPVSGNFRRYPVIGFSGNDMQQVNRIITLKNGEVWLATGNMGLAEYSHITDSFRFHKPVPAGGRSHLSEHFTVRDMCIDPGNDSIFWLISGDRILQFNRITLKFNEIQYTLDRGNGRPYFTCIRHGDSRGIWLGTWGAGIMHLQSGTLLSQVFLPDQKKKKWKGLIVQDIAFMNDSILLMACAQTGLFSLNLHNRKFQDLTPFPSVSTSEPDLPYYHYISITPDAGVFIGVTGMLLQMHPAYNRMADYFDLSSPGSDSLTECSGLVSGFDPDSYLLSGYGTKSLIKVSKEDLKTSEISVAHPSGVRGLRDMDMPLPGLLLAVGFDGNLYGMRSDDRKMKIFTPGSIKNVKFSAVESDGKGYFWLLAERNLFRMDAGSLQVMSSFSLRTDTETQANTEWPLRFFDMQTDSSGRAWLSSNQGIWLADPGRDTVIHYSPFDSKGKKLRHSLIKSFLIDRADHIWVGYNGEGLQVFSADSFSLFNDIDPVTFPSVQINDLAQTAEGQILAATPEGLIKIDPDNFEWQLFGKFDGLSGQSIESGLFASPDGNIFVPFRNRYHVFHENELNLFFGNFKINITGFSINGIEQSTGELNRAYPEMNLNHRTNNLSVSFAAMQWQYPWRTRYYYRFSKDRDTSGWFSLNEPRLQFNALSPGKYTLQLGASGAGNSKGWSKQIIFHIKPPFWLENWFIFLMNVVVILIIYALYRFRIEQLKKPVQVRDTISRDLHDDIGSSLSNVQILNELALRNMENPGKSTSFLLKAREDMLRISESLSDIVWNVNPRNDDLSTMFIRMKRYAADAFDGKDIRYELNFPVVGKTLKMKMERKRDLYLVFKESVNNLVKYSDASRAWVSIEIREKRIFMLVGDNGIGFDSKETVSGNGLQNMKKRARISGGKITVNSKPGEGTEISLEIPLK